VDGAKPTILVCDDDERLRELMRVTLGPEHDFVEAGDADRALELLRSVHPDLALVDVMLPGRSGLELLREVRADRDLSDTPIVVVSAWSRESDRTAAAEAGADAFLGKPFELEDLTSTVADLLAQRR
jgi:DNA-binding response OmpR family regulator